VPGNEPVTGGEKERPVKTRIFVALASLMVVTTLSTQAMAQGSSAAAHIRHITTHWNDTPGGKGLLPTADAEAAVALQHAKLAVADPTDLAAVKLHVGHVAHALDPAGRGPGPGLGYGLMRAAAGIIAHVSLAAEAPDATPAIKTHAVHVAASADNVVERAKQALVLTGQVAKAKSAAVADGLARQILALVNAMIDGQDADHDGRITWKKGEGGLAQVHQHLGFMGVQ